MPDYPALAAAVRTIPDFPSPGIQFKDITPILADPALLQRSVEALVKPYFDQGITKVIGIESRGFIFGAMMAERLRAGFVPVRKAGKLPAETIAGSYDLEYGSATIELHVDAIQPGEKVLIHDDVIATGGTAEAAARLVERSGGTVAGFSFLVELSFLDGRSRLTERVESVLTY
ncbi:MAG: adenine phosphoribosyltransferase [Bacteroidota bacterium]